MTKENSMLSRRRIADEKKKKELKEKAEKLKNQINEEAEQKRGPGRPKTKDK